MTRECRISSNYHLDPTYWTLPTVSEHNKMVSVATGLLVALKQVVPITTADTQKHAKTVKRTTIILCNNPQQ